MKARKVILLAILTLSASLVAPAQERREVTKTVPLSKDGYVSIDTYKGSVNVETWDRAEVDIKATIESDDWGRDEQEKVRDTEIVIEESSGSVRIKSDYEKLKRRHSSFWDSVFDGISGNLPYVHYTIKMPSTAKLRIKDYKSESHVANLQADLDIDTYKGTVEVRALNGGLSLETYKGDCRIEFAKMTGDSRFETYKGDIRISLPASASFNLDADVGRRGDFDSDFHYSSSASSRSRRDYWYRGDINGGGPSLRLRTDKGSYRLVKN